MGSRSPRAGRRDHFAPVIVLGACTVRGSGRSGRGRLDGSSGLKTQSGVSWQGAAPERGPETLGDSCHLRGPVHCPPRPAALEAQGLWPLPLVLWERPVPLHSSRKLRSVGPGCCTGESAHGLLCCAWGWHVPCLWLSPALPSPCQAICTALEWPWGTLRSVCVRHTGHGRQTEGGPVPPLPSPPNIPIGVTCKRKGWRRGPVLPTF